MANYYASITKPTTGTTVSKSTFGDLVIDDIDFLAASKPNCRVYNSANISITTSGTAQVLTFDSERYDKGAGSHSTSANTSRLTVPAGCAGVYLIGAHVEFASNATGYRHVQFLLNGGTIIGDQMTAALSGQVTRLSLTSAYSLAVGDYVEVRVVQTSGGALNVDASANSSPEFWWQWVST